jgi:hypothetical protein
LFDVQATRRVGLQATRLHYDLAEPNVKGEPNMRALFRWWPSLLAASLLVLALTGRFPAGEPDQEKNNQGPDKKKIRSTIRAVIKTGARLHNGRDYAGSYRFFQGGATVLRSLLASQPKLQKSLDSSLAEAERNPSMSQRGWIMYRSLSNVYAELGPMDEQMENKADRKKGKKGKEAKKKKKGKKDKRKDARKDEDKSDKDQGTDKKEQDKDVPKDLLKDVKKADKQKKDRKSKDKEEKEEKSEDKGDKEQKAKDKGDKEQKARDKGDKEQKAKDKEQKAKDKKDNEQKSEDKEDNGQKSKDKEQAKGNAKVSGKVLFKGKPVTAGVISFVDKKGKTYSAPLEADGTYSLEKLAPGEYRLVIDTSKVKKNRVLLPIKYSDPKKTSLRSTVAKGNNTFDIQLAD